MRAHLAAGNRCGAVRQYEQFCVLLGTALGLIPSALMEEVLASLIN